MTAFKLLPPGVYPVVIPKETADPVATVLTVGKLGSLVVTYLVGNTYTSYHMTPFPGGCQCDYYSHFEPLWCMFGTVALLSDVFPVEVPGVKVGC